MKNLLLLVVVMACGCTAGINGARVSAGQTYFSPYTAAQDGTAVVYIYWNQPDIERYLPMGARKPRWHTYVNRKRNAEMESGGYSVVEVNPGSVRIESRMRLGANELGIDDRAASIRFTAKAGETYFVYAQMRQGSLGKQLEFKRELSEREAYRWLYGLLYQENLQDSILY